MEQNQEFSLPINEEPVEVNEDTKDYDFTSESQSITEQRHVGSSYGGWGIIILLIVLFFLFECFLDGGPFFGCEK
jgi:hypothetical protein